MTEIFEDSMIVRELKTAYPSFDASTRQQLRDRLRFVAETREPIPARVHKPTWSSKIRRRPRVLAAAILLGVSGVGGVAASAAAGYFPFMPDRTLGRGYTPGTPYTFTDQPVPAGMVSKQQAINTALGHTAAAPFGALPPDVMVTAHFGTYADPSFLPRPVWLVTFSGSGVNIAVNDGGPATRSREKTGSPYVAHRDIVVIDGKTGAFLTEEMFSQP